MAASSGMSGKKHSQETKAKMSLALKGRVFSAETRAKMAASQCIPCSLHGADYPSVKALAEAVGVPVSTVRYRLDNNCPGWTYLAPRYC